MPVVWVPCSRSKFSSLDNGFPSLYCCYIVECNIKTSYATKGFANFKLSTFYIMGKVYFIIDMSYGKPTRETIQTLASSPTCRPFMLGHRMYYLSSVHMVHVYLFNREGIKTKIIFMAPLASFVKVKTTSKIKRAAKTIMALLYKNNSLGICPGGL